MNKPIMQPDKNVQISNKKQEFYHKIMVSTNFKPAKDSLQAVQIMFNALWPTMERLLGDNEIMLEEQASILKRYSTLDEDFKKLVTKYESLKEQAISFGIDVQEEGSSET